MSQMDIRLYNAAMEKLANLGGLQASYVADAAGADASERASQLAGDRAREDEDGGLLDDLFGQAGDADRMINKRKRHANAAFAENDGARLLNVVDPSKLITDSPDKTLTGLAMVSGKKNKDREGRVLNQYKDIINQYQDPVKMDGEKTTRETPYHLMMQGNLADQDMDVAGHKQQRKEKPLNYWLNPLDRTGPLNELSDRLHRRIGASVAQPDSALGRFGMGAGNVGTLGLLGALAGGEDAQNKLRRSAVDNEIFDEHSMPEGADKSNKSKDGDGDGKVNDGTSEEKEAAFIYAIEKVAAYRRRRSMNKTAIDRAIKGIVIVRAIEKAAELNVADITKGNTTAAGALLGGGLGAGAGALQALIQRSLSKKDEEDQPSILNRALMGGIAGGGAGAAGGYLGAPALRSAAKGLAGDPSQGLIRR